MADTGHDTFFNLLVDKKENRVYICIVMNVNVLVVNVHRDFWPADRRTSPRFETKSPVEEVIDLLPHNGAWVGTEEMSSPGNPGYTVDAQEAGSLYAASRFVTYDQKGRVLRAPSDKGRHINLTA